jgi:AraC-like DNA-binding protein
MILMPNILPHPALRPYIKHYFLLHVFLTNTPDEQRIKPIPPDADQSLFFYPRSEVKVIINSTKESRASASSVFVAQQTTRINIQFGDDHLIIQVCFHPGFMYKILGKIPINELMNQEIDAELFSDQEMKVLNKQLRETIDYKTMINLIETYFLKRLAKLNTEILPIDKAISCLRYSTKPLSLDWLASEACLSNRQFERNFIQRMGMSPKFYARIVRFDRAFKMKQQHPDISWLNIAYSCGYFDFSHLMKDFSQFAEVTPSILLEEDIASPDKMLII